MILSLFPQLLTYQFFVITILRAYAGLVVLYLSYEYMRERGQITQVEFPITGRMPEWLLTVGSFILLITGILLLIGLYTQAAAIVALITGLKHAIFSRRYPILPISAGTGAFLFIVGLCLLSFGAGAFGFDLPV